MWRRNLPVLVNFPRQIPREVSFSRSVWRNAGQNWVGAKEEKVVKAEGMWWAGRLALTDGHGEVCDA